MSFMLETFFKSIVKRTQSVFVIDFLFNYKTYIKKHRFVCYISHRMREKVTGTIYMYGLLLTM